MDRVMVTIPHDIRQQLDAAATAVTENRSQFVRRAIQERIERLRQERFERALIEAYQAGNDNPAADVHAMLAVQEQAAGETWCWDD